MWTRWSSVFLKHPFCQASVLQFILFFIISRSVVWLGIEWILSPKQRQRPLPSLLSVSSSMGGGHSLGQKIWELSHLSGMRFPSSVAESMRWWPVTATVTSLAALTGRRSLASRKHIHDVWYNYKTTITSLAALTGRRSLASRKHIHDIWYKTTVISLAALTSRRSLASRKHIHDTGIWYKATVTSLAALTGRRSLLPAGKYLCIS